jgi:hypothetical protein
MTLDEKLDKAEEFLEEFKTLVHKYAGSDYSKADPELLAMIQDRTSVFQPYLWS